MDEVFKALADPSRRQLLDVLNERNGQTLRELCAGLTMARQSVSKHLAVLEAAGLVTTSRRGREKLHHLDAAPINAIAERWMNRYDRRRAGALADLKRALEAEPMNEFAYTTYINTTPEKLWQALTEPAFTAQYWGVSFETDWTKGSPMAWVESGAKTSHPEQVVLESDPHRRLSYTWHTFTAEWAKANGIDDETLAKLQAESRSKVTFTLEPHGEMVKLTVLHDGFDDNSTTLAMCSQGWPALLSSLKTLLETGVPLP
ncbi:metalloregulator ArsR/SmtB family transcription factor [Amycolatopsis sp. OK19-0408]|uniref:Metalloregulator ArsR/SmtB family transcription factor n=1 Tax=Amycolatopsis iheyensis TaxID=2945988 RepID=A0A9X2SL39_9PSEU|nr:metalloregulator ArsR/SmtB family transcription factor [Amycolatopsis iheyensis]MCR6485798.1 metalloregulator ArsR/SmtB family transcription factor [Amycolatopsis iheyensis]